MMTLQEMHSDLLSRIYRNTIQMIGDEGLSKAEKQVILKEACTMFSLATEKIPGASVEVELPPLWSVEK